VLGAQPSVGGALMPHQLASERWDVRVEVEVSFNGEESCSCTWRRGCCMRGVESGRAVGRRMGEESGFESDGHETRGVEREGEIGGVWDNNC
jgi:hypothetical protein